MFYKIVSMHLRLKKKRKGLFQNNIFHTVILRFDWCWFCLVMGVIDVIKFRLLLFNNNLEQLLPIWTPETEIQAESYVTLKTFRSIHPCTEDFTKRSINFYVFLDFYESLPFVKKISMLKFPWSIYLNFGAKIKVEEVKTILRIA